MEQLEEPYGQELTLDLYGCDLETIQSEELLIDYARKLVELIDMVIYGEPVAPYFGTGSIKTAGRSLFTFIETSSITGHFSDYRRSAYLNIFSCKDFDPKFVEDFTVEYFGAEKCISVCRTRQ